MTTFTQAVDAVDALTNQLQAFHPSSFASLHPAALYLVANRRKRIA